MEDKKVTNLTIQQKVSKPVQEYLSFGCHKVINFVMIRYQTKHMNRMLEYFVNSSRGLFCFFFLGGGELSFLHIFCLYTF